MSHRPLIVNYGSEPAEKPRAALSDRLTADIAYVRLEPARQRALDRLLYKAISVAAEP